MEDSTGAVALLLGLFICVALPMAVCIGLSWMYHVSKQDHPKMARSYVDDYLSRRRRWF